MDEAEKLKRLRVFTRLAMDKNNGADAVEAIKAVADVFIQVWYGWKMANRRAELQPELKESVQKEQAEALKLFRTEPALAYMAAAFMEKMDYRVTVDNFNEGKYKEFFDTFVFLSLDTKRRKIFRIDVKNNKTFEILTLSVETRDFPIRLADMLNNSTPF